MASKGISFDPRSKLATVFVASLLLMLRVPLRIEAAYITFLFVLLLINGGIKKGLSLYSLYWVLLLLEHFVFTSITNGLTALISFLLVGNRLMLGPVMAGVFAVNRTKISEWITALKQWHCPNSLLIPFIVVCRFFPTIVQDFKHIRNAMKYRGIITHPLDMIKKPFQTLEFIIVPILISVETTSLDVSAAALVRGLGNPGKHTSVYEVRLKRQDYVLLGLLVGGLLWGVILG